MSSPNSDITCRQAPQVEQGLSVSPITAIASNLVEPS